MSKLVFDWSIELGQIKRMAADARLWNRVAEAQSPLHYFAGARARLVCARVPRARAPAFDEAFSSLHALPRAGKPP